jgi:hypothetical protein
MCSFPIFEHRHKINAMKNRVTLFFPLAVGIIFMTSCGTPPEASIVIPSADTSVDLDTPAVQDDPLIDLDEIDLPTPLQMANILNKAGLEYSDGLTNPASNAAQYTTFYKRVANFGVYSGDLSYCALNGQKQDALIYLQSISDLSNELGFSNIINTEEMLDNFENNIDDQEALRDLIAEMEDNLEEYTEMNETKYILPVLFAGGWLESMYLATNSVKESDDEKLKSEMIKQMRILDNLLLGLMANPDKEKIINGLITDLEAIKAIFTGFDFIQNIGNDATEIAITDEEFQLLAMKIESVRSNVIAP